MSTGYAEKSALFCETQKALKALYMRAKQYGVDEVYNWCRFVLGTKPGSFTDGQKIAAVFFLDNAVKTARGFAAGAVATITGHKDAIAHLVKEQQDFDRITTFDGFKPKATYRLDEQIEWKLIQARVMVGCGVYNPLAKPEGRDK